MSEQQHQRNPGGPVSPGTPYLYDPANDGFLVDLTPYLRPAALETERELGIDAPEMERQASADPFGRLVGLGLQQGSFTLNGRFDSADAGAYFPPPAPQIVTVSVSVPANRWHALLDRLRGVRGFGWLRPRMKVREFTGEMVVQHARVADDAEVKLVVHAPRHWWPIAVEVLEDEAPEFAAQFAEHRGVGHQFGLLRSGLGIHGWRCMTCDVGGDL